MSAYTSSNISSSSSSNNNNNNNNNSNNNRFVKCHDTVQSEDTEALNSSDVNVITEPLSSLSSSARALAKPEKPPLSMLTPIIFEQCL